VEFNIIGIISIILVFFVFTGIIFFFFRKNGENNVKKDSDDESILNEQKQKDKNLSKIERLKSENKKLNSEIFFLEEKNRKLKQKVKELKETILSLEEQKEQLAKSEKRLKELRVQKEETLAMVAHDIKNPASTIKNFVDLLESYDLNAMEQQEVLKGLLETSSRILNLADEFSTIVAQEHVSITLHKKKNNLNETVEEIVNVNKVKAESKDIALLFKKSFALPKVELDENKIKEVLDNFVGNAIKYSPKKATVNVTTQFDDKYAIVEVKDNGFGLTEDEIVHAFEKGVTLSTKPTGGESSSGLGLWIAKKIVEEHNGKVWVKSKKGIGSTFGFKLPLEEKM
jgi:signal transduction histidine kinase